MRTIARQDPLSKGIFQARILEWIAISTSKRSSLSRDQTSISRVSNIRRRILYHCATWKPKQTKTIPNFLGFPGGTSGQEPACQCRRHKRHRFHPWDRKIPWKRAWQPTLVFLPGEFMPVFIGSQRVRLD